jgi:hypothetical protein
MPCRDRMRTHGERKALRINIRRVKSVQHVVKGRDLTVLIGNLHVVSDWTCAGSMHCRALTIGNWTSVSPFTRVPNSLMSFTHEA